MKALRAFAATAVTALLVATIALYGLHAARASDHQDSPTVVARPGADITDVFVYPAPDNVNNVVLAMDVYPLIPGGMSTQSQYAFDPSVLYQFKIASNIANKDYTEKSVIQFAVSGSGQSQTLTMYGPAAPNEVGTANTTLKNPTGTVPFNTPTKLDNNQIQVFAGTRRDPFFFDLAQFFKIVPDRNYMYHENGATVPAPSASSFNGFAAGNLNGCLTTPSSNILANFDVLQIAVEVPKTMLEPSGAPLGKIGIWATTATTSGS
jgi:hypothetical protein